MSVVRHRKALFEMSKAWRRLVGTDQEGTRRPPAEVQEEEGETPPGGSPGAPETAEKPRG